MSEDSNNLPTKVENSLMKVMKEASQSTKKIKTAGQFLNFLEEVSVGGANEISLETQKKLHNHLVSMTHGLNATVPLICGGKHCPIAKSCPFTKFTSDGEIDEENSEWPVLKTCPIEQFLLKTRVYQYVEEHNLHTESPIELSLITKLAELDVYEARANYILAHGDKHGQGTDLLAETIESVNPVSGAEHRGVKIHPAWELKERIHKLREQVLKKLVASPEDKLNAAAKMKSTGEKKDLSNLLSSLKHKMEEIKNVEVRQRAIDVTPDDE